MDDGAWMRHDLFPFHRLVHHVHDIGLAGDQLGQLYEGDVMGRAVIRLGQIVCALVRVRFIAFGLFLR